MNIAGQRVGAGGRALRKGLLIALAIALLGIPGTRDLIIDGLGPDRGQARAQPKPARRWEMNNLSPISALEPRNQSVCPRNSLHSVNLF